MRACLSCGPAARGVFHPARAPRRFELSFWWAGRRSCGLSASSMVPIVLRPRILARPDPWVFGAGRADLVVERPGAYAFGRLTGSAPSAITNFPQLTGRACLSAANAVSLDGRFLDAGRS